MRVKTPLLLIALAVVLLAAMRTVDADQPMCRDIDGNFTQPLNSYFYGANGETFLCVDTGVLEGKWVEVPRALSSPEPSPTASRTPEATATAHAPVLGATRGPESHGRSLLPVVAASGSGALILAAVALMLALGAAVQGVFTTSDGLRQFDAAKYLGWRRFVYTRRVPLTAIFEELFGTNPQPIDGFVNLGLRRATVSAATAITVDGRAFPGQRAELFDGSVIEIAEKAARFERRK